MKQWFVALSFLVFVTMALKIFLEPSQSDLARNSVRKNFKYFTEIRPETLRQDKGKEIKLTTSKERLSNTEKVTVSLEKPLATLKCGYDASSYKNLLTLTYLYNILKIKILISSTELPFWKTRFS